MITACHNCKFNGLAEAFASFADKLPQKKPANLATSLEYVRRYLLARCKNCKRASQDDIRIQKTPHAKSEYMTVTPATQGGRVEKKRSSTVTALDEENEKRLRMAMATLFGLSPIQLLLVQHLMRGGRLAKFGDTIRVTHEQIRRYRGSERAQAGMMRDAILARASMLAPVLAPCYDGATYQAGHDTGDNATAHDTVDVNGGTTTDVKATAQEQDDNALEASLHELPAGDLFELAGLDVPFDKLERKTRR